MAIAGVARVPPLMEYELPELTVTVPEYVPAGVAKCVPLPDRLKVAGDPSCPTVVVVVARVPVPTEFDAVATTDTLPAFVA